MRPRLMLNVVIALSLLLLCLIPSTSSQYINLGYQTDATATSTISSAGEATNDLHCNPIQQYNTLPAYGALLQRFATYYNPSGTTVSGVCRMALYQVTSAGVWILVAGTIAASDLPMVPGASSSPTLVVSSGPLYYPNQATSATILPNTQYSICFSNNGGNLTADGMISQYLWTESTSLVNYALASQHIHTSPSLPTQHHH